MDLVSHLKSAARILLKDHAIPAIRNYAKPEKINNILKGIP